MSYSYSGNPAASLVDACHYYLGNTDPGNPIATDEECAFALQGNGNNPLLAAAALAETKAMSFVYRPSSVTRLGRTVSYSAQAQNFLMLAKTLRLKASIATSSVYAGGLSEAEHDAAQRQTDLTQPYATRHLFEQGPTHRYQGEDREG